MNNFNQLNGRVVKDAFYDGDSIYLQLENAIVKLEPEGDCCSTCYVQHVSGVQALLGGTIESVENIESEPTEIEKKGAEVLDGWGHRFRIVGSGIFDIEMRLSHNGYYGGWMNITVVDAVPKSATTLTDF